MVRCDEALQRRKGDGRLGKRKDRKEAVYPALSVRFLASPQFGLKLFLSMFNHNVPQQSGDCMYGTEGERNIESEGEIKIDPKE